MSENEPMFRTTGRRMTGQLERALDNVTGREREHTARALEVHEGMLQPLLRALALELRLSGLREYEVIAQSEADVAGPASEERPYPASPTPGLALWYDPTTRAGFTDAAGRVVKVSDVCAIIGAQRFQSAATPPRLPIRVGPGYAAGAVALRPGPPARLLIRLPATPPDGEHPPVITTGYVRVARARLSRKETKP